jgi:arginyl-tRNA synthetase
MTAINDITNHIINGYLAYYNNQLVVQNQKYIIVQNNTKDKSSYIYFGNKLANVLNQPPTTILQNLASYLSVVPIIEKTKIEGHALIIYATKEYLSNKLIQLYNYTHNNKQEEILVDFSSPNVAKEMHVGHLRSTIIGDSICNLFEYQGYKVHRVNHVGDFGLNFGILIHYVVTDHPTTYQTLTLDNLQALYAEGKKQFDSDQQFKAESYKTTQLIQSQENQLVNNIYQYIKEVSRIGYTNIYNRLGIKITEVGESWYLPYLADIITDLKPITTFDNGRYIIKETDTDVTPLTIIKSDGAYTYDTTDLAAIKYRLNLNKVNTILYVVDNGQKDHFDRIFSVAEKMNWTKGKVVKHVPFGVVKFNGKKIKTRDGNTIKLVTLLDTAVAKVAALPANSDIQKEDAIKIIAYNSVKYADLSTSRISDYSFSFDTMLDLTGNTAPYLMYNYVRTCSIMKKAGITIDKIDSIVVKDEDVEICKQLLMFSDVVNKLNEDLLFHNLCEYLYKLSSIFSSYLKKVRVLNIIDGLVCSIDMDRLKLCEVYRKVVGDCFSILGLNVLDEM